MTTEDLLPSDHGIVIRNILPKDIPKIVDLQKEPFPYLARYGNIWHPDGFKAILEPFLKGSSSLLNQMVP
jgi:hypothetical protein